MNVFKKKKTPDPLPPPPLDTFVPSPASPGFKKAASRWRRNKKAPEEPHKTEVDISAALPSTDDFRTSLLMPNLSARFSMLREQDDPRSLLGKASDDSVLQPRRRSRMTGYGFGPTLGDIAEVSSVRSSSVRAPWANDRQHSFASEDGYGSEADAHGGSMLARARPGEGNVLFGGRQKVYMIGASGANAAGRAVYEDDIKQSAFQKLRRDRHHAAALQGRSSDDSQEFDFGLESHLSPRRDHPPDGLVDPAKDHSVSPSLSAYDKKRSTASTSRSDARSSTAATSVVSQPLTSATHSPAVAAPPPLAAIPAMAGFKRPDTKGRRMYEHGLDQHLQEQQTSALTRLNSIQRHPPIGRPPAPYLHGVKSAGDLQDRNPAPVYALQPHHPARPRPLAPLKSFGPVMVSGSPSASGPQSPVSPQEAAFAENDVLHHLVNPADRGKATAMGAFNKPRQAFDEQQYLERQRQLQHSQPRAADRREPTSTAAFQQRLGQMEQDQLRNEARAAAHLRGLPAPAGADLRPPPPLARPAPLAVASSDPSTATPFDKSTLPDPHRTFFGDISGSDTEDDESDATVHGRPQDSGLGAQQHARWHPTALPSVSEHPALRSPPSPPSRVEHDRATSHSRELPLPPQPLTPDVTVGRGEQAHDSPTLPTTQPLTGMVQHLRSKSNQSSIYPGDDHSPDSDVPDVPVWNAQHLDLVGPPGRSPMETDSCTISTHAPSNPWDLDEEHSRVSRVSLGPRDPSAPVSRGPSPMAAHEDSGGSYAVSPISPPAASESTWSRELKQAHTRDVSTATQLERDAFADELAARRNAIQESIKNKVERDNPGRGISPAPAAGGARKTFGILRSKDSRDSDMSHEAPVQRHAAPKAVKMLGLAPGSVLPMSQSHDRSGYSFDSNRVPTAGPQARNFSLDRDGPRSRGDSEVGRHGLPPPPSAVGSRSRANSEATQPSRSRSRTGPYRDDLEKAMVEGTGSSAAGLSEFPLSSKAHPTSRPSPEFGGPGLNHSRSNSRLGMTSYFESKGSPLAAVMDRFHAASPPPLITSNLYTPGSSARPSPTTASVSPFIAASPPQGSNVSSLHLPQHGQHAADLKPPSLHSHLLTPRSPQNPLRKKSIVKADISEPTFLMKTSSVDLVSLPPGASLRNGMDDVSPASAGAPSASPPPPPVPPINPKRRAAQRMLALARGHHDEHRAPYGPASAAPYGSVSAPGPGPPSASALSLAQRKMSEPDTLMRNRSTSHSRHPMPAVPAPPSFAGAGASPERPRRSRSEAPAPPARAGVAVEDGGMF